MADIEKRTDVANDVTEKLKNLYRLQLIDSKIDKIKTLRGELPLEVDDLADEIAGLETRINNYKLEIKDLNAKVAGAENKKNEAEVLLKKYVEQQNNVRNNREFDALSKEIENQNLDIEHCEKDIFRAKKEIEEKTALIEVATTNLQERKTDFENKKVELNDIITDTQAEEDQLNAERAEIEKIADPRLLYSYGRIRNNAQNKLAVVAIERDACGGCHNKIPPQRQLDIRASKKVIVCENCGRILVDSEILEK